MHLTAHITSDRKTRFMAEAIRRTQCSNDVRLHRTCKSALPDDSGAWETEARCADRTIQQVARSRAYRRFNRADGPSGRSNSRHTFASRLPVLDRNGCQYDHCSAMSSALVTSSTESVLLVQCCHLPQFFYLAEKLRQRHPDIEPFCPRQRPAARPLLPGVVPILRPSFLLR